MEERKQGAHARKGAAGSLVAGAIAVLLAAMVLLFSITASNAVPPTSAAAGVATTTTAQAAGSSDIVGSQVVAAGSILATNTTESINEVIADDETPLAAYPFENPLDGLVWLLLAGIVGAAAFFVVATRRMNKDISHMRSSIR